MNGGSNASELLQCRIQVGILESEFKLGRSYAHGAQSFRKHVQGMRPNINSLCSEVKTASDQRLMNECKLYIELLHIKY